MSGFLEGGAWLGDKEKKGNLVTSPSALSVEAEGGGGGEAEVEASTDLNVADPC